MENTEQKPVKVLRLRNPNKEIAKNFFDKIKGEKGDKGDKGDKPSEEELIRVITPLIPEPIKGDKGDYIVGPMGSIGPKGESVVGPAGYTPVKGKDYFDGKDGSPDTAEDIASKINSLKNSINFETLTNVPDFLTTRDIGQSGEGGGGRDITFRDSSGIVISQYVTDLQFGTGITPTYANGKITITAAGGGTVGPGTINEIAYFDSTTSIASLAVAIYPSLTELSYVKGLTSSAQTQLTARALAATTITVAGTANQITSSAGAQDLSANRTWTLSLPADVIIPTVITVPNTGLHLLDTNASHDLIIKPGSNITADRTFTITTGDTDMIVDFTAVTDEFVLAYDTGTNTWRGVAGGGGLTIGTTAIASGTIGRMLFEGASNILQQDADLFFDQTNTRLGLGTSTPNTTLHNTGSTTLGVTTSAAGTLTLNATTTTYVFTGTTTTWSLPTIGSTNTAQVYLLKNRGSGAITLDVTGGGATIYDTSVVASFIINPGEAYIVQSDGTYWLMM